MKVVLDGKSMLAIVLCGFAATVGAVDTHDYDSYVKLAPGSSTVTVTTHWPTANQWNPEGEMVSTGCYLIQAGRTLTCSSNPDNPSDGPWPAAEIAVAGTFKSSTTGGRAGTPETSHLALLPGGRLLGNSGYSTFTADTLDIRGTADAPSLIENTYKTQSDKDFLYFQINSVLTASDSSCVVKFVNTAADGDFSWLQRAMRVQGVRDFPGTIVVSGANTWVRPESSPTEFNISGTLELKDGGNFLVVGFSPTIGKLKVGNGSIFRITKGRTITVNQAVELDDGVRLQIENPFGDWERGTPKAAVKIATFGPSAERPADYRKIFEVVPPNNAVGGVPDIVFAETVNGDGSVDVSIRYREVVMIAGCTSSNTPFRQGGTPDYSRFSDGNPMSSEKDYYTVDVNVYVTDCATPFIFTGHSLTIGGTSGKLAIYSGITFVCSNLYLAGSVISQQKAAQWAVFDGNLHAQGGGVAFAGKAGVEIKSNIHGASDLTMYRKGSIDGEDQTLTSHIYLEGDNSDFSGRFLFGSFVGDETGSHPSELHIWNKTNLGGAMVEFAVDGVSIADACSLIYKGGATIFDEVTRGWTFEGKSALDIVQDAEVKVENRITAEDTLTKRGPGTLAVADVDGSVLSVAAGELGALSVSAFSGLSSIVFAEGTKFTVDLSTTDEELRASGADLSSTELSVPAGGVPVEFVSIPEQGCEIAVASFASAADATKFVFVKPKGYRVERSLVESGGKFILKANITKGGILLIVR